MVAECSQSNPCDLGLAAWQARWPVEAATPSGPWAVAYSAGADSTALLLAAHQRWPGRVVALHVHHGLQAAADGFAEHAQAFCAERGIAVEVRRVQAKAAPGESPEASARVARYRALADMAQAHQACVVLLAQHADDQAETLMLALSRGAGLPGLAAMPRRFERHGVVFGRPLLDVPGAELRRWLHTQGHGFLDDPSNVDQRFTRNRIRAQLMPAWSSVQPGVVSLLARSAAHAAQAQGLLEELAQLDLAQTGIPPQLRELQALAQARQGNALRYWLHSLEGVTPSTAQLAELLDQVACCTTRGHRIELRVAGGWVQRQGEQLAYRR